ncbi:MFS general substrate transporter [Atractiella rhizophila]|nr:MFS general substrate transporter [Atractiella rhizophila]
MSTVTVTQTEVDIAENSPTKAEKERSKPFHQIWQRLKSDNALLKEMACHLTMIVAGWNGAAAGPLIPYIQPYFKVSFTVTSLIYVGEAIGFVLGGISNTWLTDRYGLGKVIAFGALMQTLSYALIAPAIHMGVMVFGSVIAGYGLSLQDAAANAYIAGCPNMAFKMGLAHSFFGWGAFLSPLVGTAFVSHGVQWSLFYLTALGLSGLNVVAVILAFKLKAAPVEKIAGGEGVPWTCQERVRELLRVPLDPELGMHCAGSRAAVTPGPIPW